MSDAVLYEVRGGAAWLTLNRPDARNILNSESLTGLAAGLERAATDDSARVVVITGTGRAFCAGADLKGATAKDAESFADSGPMALAKVLSAILDHPKPTIAAVQGHVAGGGNGLVAACDFAIAVDEAMFAFSEVRVGVAPAVISVVCLPRLNPADARELLLTGERVTAERMRSAGMVTRVVAGVELEGAVLELVERLRAGGPRALAATKDLLRRVPTLTRDEAFAWTSELSASLFASDEAAAGMQAFLSKEPAPWVKQ